MIIDYSSVSSERDITADIAIVGAGVVGIALARELSESSLSVALLESGGFEQDEHSRALNEGDVTGVQYPLLTDTRARCLGGSSSRWGGWCCPLDPADFEPKAWVKLSGWPLSYSDLQVYYELAHKFLGLPVSNYSTDYWAEQTLLPPLPLATNDVSTIIHQVCGPLNVGIRYRSMLSSSQNIVAHLHATALHLQSSNDKKQIIWANVALGSGNQVRLHAKRFVLAGGGIENARLLLLSEVGGQAVGRYFCEHPHLRTSGISNISERFDLRLYQEAIYGSSAGKGCIIGALHIPEETRKREQLSNTKLFLDLDGNGSNSADLVTVWEQVPSPLSRITLSNKKDRFGKRLPRLHWELTEEDWRTVEQSSDLFRIALEDAGIGKVEPTSVPVAALVGGIGPGHHHLGTTRMSATAAVGVVDSTCRVHGIDNLYIAGTSVFPTGGHAPPTLTVIALALRLAEHLISS